MSKSPTTLMGLGLLGQGGWSPRPNQRFRWVAEILSSEVNVEPNFVKVPPLHLGELIETAEINTVHDTQNKKK